MCYNETKILKGVDRLRYLVQLIYVLIFSFAGEILAYCIPLPIPAAIYGLILLFFALLLGIVKLEKVKDISRLMILWMPVLFVAPSVNIIENWGLIAPNWPKLLIIILITTVIVFAVSGAVTNLLLKRRGAQDHEAS